MSDNNLFGRVFRTQLGAGLPEASSNAPTSESLEKYKSILEEEKIKVSAMSREELLKYAADTRAKILTAEGQIQHLVDTTYTSLQLQFLLADTVNRIIKKQPVKPIPIPSLAEAQKTMSGTGK